MSKKEKQVSILPVEDLNPVLDILDDQSVKIIHELQEEITENWNKRQIYRTETEMRLSVLNDLSFPTPGAKYWQAVREQAAHFDGLVHMSFDLRRENVKRLRLKRELEQAQKDQDELRVLELEIDLEESFYRTAHIKQHAEDRVREIQLWSKIKKELDDGSFDTKDVNSHQAISYKKALEMKAKMLNKYSAPADVINIKGQHMTAQQLVKKGGTILSFKPSKETKLLENSSEVE